MVICLIFFIFFFLVVVVIGPHSCPSITLCYDGYRRGWCLYLTWLEGHSWWWNNRRQFSHERVRKEQSYSQRSLLLRRFILHSLSSFLLHVIGSLQDRTRPRDRSFQAPLRKSYIANWPSGSDHVKHPKMRYKNKRGKKLPRMTYSSCGEMSFISDENFFSPYEHLWSPLSKFF